jgi:hypothetical protein
MENGGHGTPAGQQVGAAERVAVDVGNVVLDDLP